MTIDNINANETINSIKEKIKKDKSLPPAIIESINLLILIIQLLISRQTLNSRNSSLPPSTNNPRKTRGKDKKREKKRSSRKIGGQEGHEGSTLEQFEDPDETVNLSLDRRTLPHNQAFKKSEDEVRQVIDINLEFIVREYRAEVFKDQFGLDISQGTLCNFNKDAYDKLDNV